MRVYCQPLGCDGFGAGSLLLFFDEKRFLFDVPEGTQRYCTESKTKMMKVQGLFLTKVHPENMLGLPGMLLTLREQDRAKFADDDMKSITKAVKSGKNVMHTAREDKEAVVVSGPSPLGKLIATCDPFMRCPGFFKVSELPEELPFTVYKGEGYTISGISINNSVSYRLEVAEQPGKFLAAKAEELGVKGKKRALLKSGQSVESDKIPGRVVHPNEVLGDPIPPMCIYVVASEVSDVLAKFCTPERNMQVKGTYHVTPVQGEGYKEQFSFIDGPHFFKAWQQHTVYHSSALQHDRLHAISPALFPPERWGWEPPREDTTNLRLIKELQQLNIMSGQALQEGASEVARMPLKLEESRAEWPVELKDALTSEPLLSPTSEAEYPKLTLLGTGGMMPSKYRNVTSMLVETSLNRYVILDSGEGTLGQIRRVQDVDKVLHGLDIIWISHIHADHHVGLVTLLARRAFIAPELPPVQVVGPSELKEYLEVFGEAVQLGYTFAVCAREVDVAVGGGVVVSSIPVRHCSDAWGCTVKVEGKWKILYSGDTRPCDEVVEAGKGCDILIHEATFDDEKQEDAVSKYHSTVSEAFSVSARMEAKLTVLTHFSQRYPKTPPPTPSGTAAALGFDLMSITPSCGPLLIKMNDRLRILDEYYQKIEDAKKKANQEVLAEREKKLKEEKLLRQQKRLEKEAAKTAAKKRKTADSKPTTQPNLS